MLQPYRKPPSEEDVDGYARWLQSSDALVRREGIMRLIDIDEALGGRKIAPAGGRPMSGSAEPVAADRSAHAWDRAPLGDLHALQLLRVHIDIEDDPVNRKLILRYLAYREC